MLSSKKNQENNKSVWFIFGCLFVALLVLWYAFGLLHPLHSINQDLGRFIAITSDLLESRDVLFVNTYSHTHPDFQFVNSHWLGGVFLTFLVNIFGLSGIIFVKMLILVSTLILVMRVAYERVRKVSKESKLVLMGFALIPTIFVLFERTHVRPEIFSHFLFALFLFILTRKNKWVVWVLPALMLIWVNTHIYFILGFFLICAFGLEAIVNDWREGKLGGQTKRLIGVGISSLLLACLNPAGIRGVFYPFTVLKNYGYTIVENQTPFFLIPFEYHLPIIYTLFALLAVLVVSSALFYKKLNVSDYVIGIGLVYLGLSAMRHAYVVALGLLPIVVSNLSYIIKRTGRLEVVRIYKSVYRGAGLVAGLCIATFLVVGSLGDIDISSEESARGAVDFVLNEDIQGVMFNNFDIGGYLIYRLSPDRPVFVDNRPEAYPASFFDTVYKPMQENRAVWDLMVDRYHITYVIFGITDQTPWGQSFMNMISRHPQWVPVYIDQSSFVLLRSDILEYAGIIEKYGYR